jgi:Trk K+ transport system NAD-binding subunit
LNPNARIVLRMFNQSLVSRLCKAVPNVVGLSVSALSAPLLALTALTGEVLAAFDVGDGKRQIVDLKVQDGSRIVGRRVGEIADHDRFLVLAHAPDARPWQLFGELDRDAKLASGDRVVVCGDPEHVQRLADPSKDSFEVLWAGRLRRYGRLIHRTLGKLDLAVKICTLTLLGVILLSTIVHHFAFNHSWSESLYRTISVIATGADMGGREYEGWGKAFISFLRIAGAALIAAFTAIVTNALLTARLGGAFEVRRIPDKGHVVICGLGNVGYRVVEEFRRLDEQVVVVEQKADNPFVLACRRMGVAVINGSATVAEVLRQVRVGTARAVIAATSSDLVNLEIALLVAEINPAQRVVVRMGDSAFAETVRKAANVKLALSVAELAAPAFVAALLGDRVQTMFLVGGRMLAVLEITVTGEDKRYSDFSLRALAIDFQFIPVAVTDKNDKIQDIELSYRLQPGDRLTIVAPINQLDRLMRREPPTADWSVEVMSFLPPMRAELLVRVGTFRHLPPEETERLLKNLPFLLAENLTLGQAEEIRFIMDRERIVTRLVRRTV